MGTSLIDELTAIHHEAIMVGWDFSQLDGRLIADQPWWDFKQDCLDAIRSSARVLDMGTGGGEWLVDLIEQLGGERSDQRIAATEGWEPNVPLASETLHPHGVKVHRYDPDEDSRMPFDDGQFDLIMSRHEGMDAKEIARILAPGGRFLTQQVSGFDAQELHEWFNTGYLYPDVTIESYVVQLEEVGLTIDAFDDWTGTMTFADVQTLVTYLAFVPWDVPGFCVQDHAAKLDELAASGPIAVTQRRFRIYATK